MKIKALVLSISLLAGSAQAAFYSPSNGDNIDLSHHRFTVGSTWTNYAVASYWLNIGGISETWVWRLAGAFEAFRDQPAGTGDFEAACGTFHLGMRKPLKERLGFEYGVVVGYAGQLQSIANAQDAYSVGGFVGLDYLLDNNLLIHASLQPYAYRENFDRTAQHQIFEQGTLGLSYIFN